MVYVITHKIFDDSFIDDTSYKVLHVGNNDSYKVNYLLDTSGESISSKNAAYCELTGIYWLWKNHLGNCDSHIGIVHYRRYFVSRLDYILYTYLKRRLRILDGTSIVSVLRNCDIILPKKKRIRMTVRQFYEESHYAEDLVTTRNVIAELTPEVIGSFDETMEARSQYYGNMMICSKKVFCDYCEWLFAVLERVEKDTNLDKYSDAYQRRVFGFLAERLLQVWVKYKRYRICELHVVNPEEERETLFLRIKRHCLRKMNEKKSRT